jgi:hypothetical protein
MFILSFFELPKGVRKRLDFYRSRFFWQSDQIKKKYRLTRWNIICHPKDQGGLGIEVLDIKNKCLLSKWLFKLLNEEAMWQELLHNKYLKDKTLSQVQVKPTDSAFWKGILGGRDEFFQRGSFVLGDGRDIHFWEDAWLGDTPLSSQYLDLYGTVRNKHVKVADVLSNTPLNIGFRRVLRDGRWESWLHLVQRLMSIHLKDESDRFIWHLTASGVFSVKSLYADFMNDHTKYLQKYLWKLKVPLKIRIFMWFLHRKVILMKDNLLKRSWA